MGGCASKPKDADLNPQAVPTEVPVTPNKPDSIPQGNDNGGESQNNAAPLVDLSEPKQEAGADGVGDSKPAEAPVSAQVADLTAELTQEPEKLEAIAKESEEKKSTEASTTDTKDREAAAKEGQTKAEATPSPTSEDKTGAPVVAV